MDLGLRPVGGGHEPLERGLEGGAGGGLLLRLGEAGGAAGLGQLGEAGDGGGERVQRLGGGGGDGARLPQQDDGAGEGVERLAHVLALVPAEHFLDQQVAVGEQAARLAEAPLGAAGFGGERHRGLRRGHQAVVEAVEFLVRAAAHAGPRGEQRKAGAPGGEQGVDLGQHLGRGGVDGGRIGGEEPPLRILAALDQGAGVEAGGVHGGDEILDPHAGFAGGDLLHPDAGEGAFELDLHRRVAEGGQRLPHLQAAAGGHAPGAGGRGEEGGGDHEQRREDEEELPPGWQVLERHEAFRATDRFGRT